MNGLKKIKITPNALIALLCVISLFFLPDISLPNLSPKASLIDLLLPFMGLIILSKWKHFRWSNFYTVTLCFCIYIVLTMYINKRLHSISDYFEIFKFLKFLVVIAWSTTLHFEKELKPVIKPAFIILSAINLLHFFELFHINELIANNYGGAKNITEFGLNSIGQPVSKRMTGLAFNPNNNAIIFSFFAIYFLPLFSFERKYIYSLLALFLAFLCQSKTTFIVLFTILLFALLFGKSLVERKKIWKYLASIVLLYFISYLLCSRFNSTSTYSTSMFTGEVINSGSARGRLESWTFLWKMIIEKPLFGHGPNKEFFYNNSLYSENEYILFLWRYGVIGLVFYLYMFLKTWCVVKKKANKYLGFYTCIVILFLTSSLTNNPFADRNIMLLFAITLGLLFRESEKEMLIERKGLNE